QCGVLYMAKKKPLKSLKNGIAKLGKAIASFIVRLTAPIRATRVWKFLRRTILRSPFKGYFVESFRELRKVTWPDRKTSWRLTIVVILFSAVFSAFTTLLDIGFEKLAKQIFLK